MHLGRRRRPWQALVLLVATSLLLGCGPSRVRATGAGPSGARSAPSTSAGPTQTSPARQAPTSPAGTSPAGTSPAGTSPAGTSSATRPRAPAPVVPLLVGLAEPGHLQAFLSPLPGEGVWHTAGRTVQSKPGIFETTLRPPGSSLPAGIAWMDTRLLRAQLYSGSASPGAGPWKLTAAIQPAAARTLVAAFNGGFKFPATDGGYYSEGRLASPLRPGGASLVLYRNGDATVGQWGRDVTMTSQVMAVRQNLTLLVDHAAPVSGLDPYDHSRWGSTIGNVFATWRSGLGVTATGALVYVYGPSLGITQLAALLVRAGAIRAMELDINPNWPVFATYHPSTPDGLASPADGSNLLPGTVQQPSTFFESSWARDFVTMSAR